MADGRSKQLCSGALYSREKDPDIRAKGNLVDTARKERPRRMYIVGAQKPNNKTAKLCRNVR